MLEMIKTSKARAETTTAHRDFIALARYAMLTKGRNSEARAQAVAEGASRRVERIFERADPGQISAPGGSPETWGGEALSDYAQAEAAFASSLRNSGAVDRMLPDTISVPLRTRFAVNASTIVADEVGEAIAKPVSDLAIEGDVMVPKKVAAIVALTKDLVKIGGPVVERMIDRELRNAITAGTDGMILPDLVAATSPIPSSGNFLEDLSSLLSAATFGADARLYLVLRPEDVAQVAVMQEVAGPAFPQMGVNGGSVAGVTVVVSPELADGTALLIDAAQLLTASTPIRLDSSEHAMLAFDSNAPTTMTSLWQKNLLAVLAERMIAVKPLRADAVQSLSGVGYSGGSPA